MGAGQSLQFVSIISTDNICLIAKQIKGKKTVVKNIFHNILQFFSSPAQENEICNANIELNYFIYTL